jgi:ribosomal-protein-alanine N-acetyltransferase
MSKYIETRRLLLRELFPSDDLGIFELDSNPEVHLHLGNNPITDIEQSREIISNIRQQYIDNGIGRWAVILKETNQFIGWAGLKLERNVNGHDQFYDLGYRFIPKYWGKGYASEAASAFVKYGFQKLKLETICAYTSSDNIGSRKVLEKTGLQYVNTFEYEGGEELWFEIKNPNN